MNIGPPPGNRTPYLDPKQLGARGEAVAADWLQHRGYTLIARNWRDGHREIDLLMALDKLLVVVEVKTCRARASSFSQANPTGWRPEWAVDWRKQRHLAKAARAFLVQWPHAAEIRFDIIAIRAYGARCRLWHIPDAFYPGAG